MSKIKLAGLLCLSVLVIFSVSSVNAATDNKVQSVSKNTEFKQNLKNLDTTNPVTKEIKKTDNKTYDLPQVSGSVQMDENTKAIKVKFNGKEFKITDKDTKALTNELVSGSLIRKNSNGDVTSSVEAVDGGIRIVLNIEKTTDKFYTYDFPVEAESGTKYVMETTGGAKLVSSTGATIVAVVIPWATDSNKKSLKTWYTVENNGAVLRQHVDLANAKFPVLADPTWCGNMVDRTDWVTNWTSAGWQPSLNVTPTWCARLINWGIWHPVTISFIDYTSQMYTDIMWSEIVSKTPTLSYLRIYPSLSYKSLSMYNQLRCHILFGMWKGNDATWNLDPNRRLVTTISDYYSTKCNPSF